MPRRTDTRDRMLRAAAMLFHTRGYHATGLNQVLAEGGAPKGSLYFHFPGGKEQLAVEAVDLAGGELCERITAAAAAAKTPANGLGRIIDLLAEALTASDYTAGCPVATVALDAASESDAIRSACDRAYTSWIDAVARQLAAAGVARARAVELATFTIASIEGALLLSRTRRDVAPLRAVGTRLRKSIVDELEEAR